MTAEALSPPSPMQSLRERLIQEGSIVPNQANPAIVRNPLIELADALKEKMAQVFAVIAEAGKKSVALEKYLQAFKERFSGIDLVSKSGCSYYSLLSFLNLHRIIEVFLKHQDNKIGDLLIVRTGFFFAFKENMKNTP